VKNFDAARVLGSAGGDNFFADDLAGGLGLFGWLWDWFSSRDIRTDLPEEGLEFVPGSEDFGGAGAAGEVVVLLDEGLECCDVRVSG
jgi:hypothetical protein